MPLAESPPFTPSVTNVEAVLATKVEGKFSMLEASGSSFCVLFPGPSLLSGGLTALPWFFIEAEVSEGWNSVSKWCYLEGKSL